MSEQIFIQGPVGKIELFVDRPEGEIKGFAVVCHPTHYKVEPLNIKSLLF